MAECTKLTREQIFNVALLIGKVLLKNGAETYRVEETIVRFCRWYGCGDINVFVTPTVIILGDEIIGNASLICRIRWRSTNLSVISAVNDFSYNLDDNKLDYEGMLKYFEELLNQPAPYSKWCVCIASGIASAGFSAMLGGNSHDFAAAFITGGATMLLRKQLAGYRPSAFWSNALSGASIGLLTLLCCAVSAQCTGQNITVGALMPFLPGVAFTNGIRDYMAGDLISGNSRIAEALLFAAAIALGLAIVMLAWYNWGWTL